MENCLEFSPTGRRLSEIDSTSFCSNIDYCFLCQFEEETLEHSFLHCPVARIIWRYSNWPLNSICFQPLTIFELLKVIINPRIKLRIPEEEAHHFQLFVAVACDQIWMWRNRVRLNPFTIIDPLSLSNSINCLAKEHSHAWSDSKFIIHHSARSSLQNQALYRIQYDAAVWQHFFMPAVVCLDQNNKIMAAKTQILPEISSPISAEAYAALLAATLSSNLGLDQLVLEEDSSTITAAIHCESLEVDWSILNIISEASFSLLSSTSS